MTLKRKRVPLPTATLVRYVILDLAGVLVLVLKRHYAGPGEDAFQCWAGNVAVSFAVYFLARMTTLQLGLGHVPAAAGALLVVELFEATDGFGVMANVYDPWDYVANALGVALALATDAATSAIAHRRS